MKKYVLQLEDYQEMTKIIKTTNALNTLYDKLYDYDLSNKRNTKEYEDLLKYIFITKETESRQYAQFVKTESKAKAFYNFFSEPNNIKYKLNTNIPDKRVVKRIFFNLYVKFEIADAVEEYNRYDFCKNTSKVDVYDADFKEFCQKTKLNNYFNKDIINIMIVLLNEHIKTLKNANEYKDLLKALYDTIFHNRDIEEEILFKKYNITDDIYVKSKYEADYLDIDDFDYDDFKIMYCEKAIKDLLTEIFKLSDKRYKERKNKNNLCINILLIKACIILIGEEGLMIYEELLDEFIETFEDDSLVFVEETIDKLKDILVNMHKYKKNVHVFKLRYPNLNV